MQIDWTATGNNALLQNASFLLALHQYEIPYDSGRGIDTKLIDRSDNIEAMAISEAHRVLGLYQPEITILSATYSNEIIEAEVTI